MRKFLSKKSAARAVVIAALALLVGGGARPASKRGRAMSVPTDINAAPASALSKGCRRKVRSTVMNPEPAMPPTLQNA